MLRSVLDPLKYRSHAGEESLRLKDVLLCQLLNTGVEINSHSGVVRAHLVTFNKPREVCRGEFPVSNEDNSKGHLHGHALNGSQHVLVSHQISPGFASIGCFDDVGEIIQ